MGIQAFGYLSISSSKLDDWACFATDRLGMQAVGLTVPQSLLQLADEVIE